MEEWVFTKKWREACKLPVKVAIFPKSSKRDNPFALRFRRSPCRGEPYGIDFCEKCALPKKSAPQNSTPKSQFWPRNGSRRELSGRDFGDPELCYPGSLSDPCWPPPGRTSRFVPGFRVFSRVWGRVGPSPNVKNTPGASKSGVTLLLEPHCT